MYARSYHRPRWTAALVAAAALYINASVLAHSQSLPQQPGPVDQTLARKYLTDARNALSDITELPAATQLTGEPRARVQELITNFNELITKTADWRASYEKVEASLASLLASEPPPAAGTPGAVGTTGTTPALDPDIRAKLVEFGTHLQQYKSAASGAAPSAEPTSEAPTPEPPTAPPTEPPSEPPPATPPATTEERPDNPPVDPAVESAAQAADAARDILLHVEAVEVILGSQATAQKSATAAAGGTVVMSQTPNGSTKTTITNPNVTLNDSQLDQIKTHLSEIRRLVENKQ